MKRPSFQSILLSGEFIMVCVRQLFVLVFVCFCSMAVAWADGPGDNIPDKVRPIPPIGVELKDAERQALEADLKKLDQMLAELARRKDALTRELIPDVEIFSRAVHQGLEHREFFSPRDVTNASKVLEEGLKRAESLQAGEAPWTQATGLVVRGFRSRIDQTVQPYGLVIPESYGAGGPAKFRLDLWFHGRGEVLSENAFIAERMSQVGKIAPTDTFVLHPYGRYSNAFKFAGEVDVLEALEHASGAYRIDADRIAVRGFSMGGAGCWQMAVHYPDRFFVANPGAGFAETKQFLETFQGEMVEPTPYEEKLWQWYDCTGYAENLFNLPTIAYSGELDRQKQAADVMSWALLLKDLRLTHIIGPETKHAIHPDSARIIEEKIAVLARQGRDPCPREVRLTTFTLKYNRSHWLTITQLGKHWDEAATQARIVPETNTIEIVAKNVRGLQIDLPPGCPWLSIDRPVTVAVRQSREEASPQQVLKLERPETDRSFQAQLHDDGKSWKAGAMAENGLAKRHDLQGPIDDAFMSSFVVVRPTGKGANEQVQRWAVSEMEHFIREWRRQFRGDAVVKNDTEITAEDMQQSHLILFGDPTSNRVLGQLHEGLPVRWSNEEIVVGDEKFAATHHAPILIHPNPKNPGKYIVINSGFTYREYAYLNNARQVPKLPDWAVVDVRVPADSLWPGKIVAADFFDEQWQVKSAK